MEWLTLPNDDVDSEDDDNDDSGKDYDDDDYDDDVDLFIEALIFETTIMYNGKNGWDEGGKERKVDIENGELDIWMDRRIGWLIDG